jgi:hypothetical protein
LLHILASAIVQACVSNCSGLNIRLVTFLPEDTRLFDSIVPQHLPGLASGSSMSVLQGDICHFSLHGCSAIVNAANTEVQFGAGVSGAIAKGTGCRDAIDREAKNVVKRFNVMHVATPEGMTQTSECVVARNPVSILFIPADQYAPITSIAIPYSDDDPDTGAVGCVTKFANAHFSGTGGALSQDSQAQFEESMVQQLVEKGHDAASAKMMARRMTPGDMQVCDIVTLLPACDRSCWVSVSMHCDDYGVARGLPTNPRASVMAKSLGLNIDVKGDVFVSRYYDNNDDFKRMDMGQGDLSSTTKVCDA